MAMQQPLQQLHSQMSPAICLHLAGAGGLYTQASGRAESKTGKRSKHGLMTELHNSLFREIQLKTFHGLVLGLHEEKPDFWPLS